MSALTKRRRAINALFIRGKVYPAIEAFALLKKCASSPALKFVESVDAAVELGIDPRKSDQVVRNATQLPNGSGRVVRIVVFAQGEQAEAAKKAGAERVGMDDLAEEIQKGMTDFDVVIATPDAMRVVSKLGQVLGPRGLMPNPKVGTVSMNVAEAVTNAKGGQVRYRADKGGIVHTTIGKIEFTEKALAENLKALLSDLRKVKPSTAKGIYIRKVTISTTMGPGLPVDVATVDAE